MTTLTLFTAPKPYTSTHINIIQYNAIRSWKDLGNDVSIISVGDDVGVAEAAKEMGILHLPNVKRNSDGTPLVSSIFELARQNSTSPVMAYLNADIIILPDFLEAVKIVSARIQKFLLAGRRFDLGVNEKLEFNAGWQLRLISRVNTDGRPHAQGGSDYFVFPRHCFTKIPDMAIGRAGWDNWMLYEARNNGWALVDGSSAIRLIHQDHDYSHLPEGRPHYRLPETEENVRLAGGKRKIFTLMDARYHLVGGEIKPVPFTWKKFWREVEIWPLTTLHCSWLSNVFYAVFHPIHAYHDIRIWLRNIQRRNENRVGID